MGKASTAKKVARAASTGGGRTAGGAKPWVWYFAMGGVVVIGLLGIVFSRDQRRDELAATTSDVAPIANRDHWHAAYGLYLCKEFVEPIAEQRDPKGIHTHADGLIHIHPFVPSASGTNATLARFAEAAGLTLTDSKLKVPGGDTFEEGKTKCDGKDGLVQVKVNDRLVLDDVTKFQLQDRDLVTIAFAPEGAELPAPPSAANIDNPGDLDEPTTTTVVGGDAGETPTTAEGGTPSTDTTVPAGASTTIPGTTTTTR